MTAAWCGWRPRLSEYHRRDFHIALPLGTVSRRIRVFKRLTLPEQIIKLGGLPVTTPARTACDLVMSPEDIPDPSTVNALVCQLMSAYQFRPNDCLQIVKEHRHHKYAGRARMFFESVRRRWTNRLWSNGA